MADKMLRSVSKLHLAKPVVPKTAVRALSTETYTEKQAKLGRPVSPHVTIYKFPPAALTSITNRVTGVMLTTGLTGVGALALVGADVPALMSTLGDCALFGTAAKFAVGFPLIYHYMGGIRHLIWDKNPDTLVTEEVQKSSYILAGAATVVSLGVALI